MALDINKLSGLIPDDILDDMANQIMPNYGITTELQVAHFLAQCKKESLNFTKKEENLNYSESGLLKTFPKYFDAVSAKEYANKPVKIANRVYANRFGNKDELSGDGFKFRGRGYIQLTFKDNYIKYGNAIKEDLVTSPDIILTGIYPLDSAAYFFKENNLFKTSNEGATLEVVKKITKKVSGSENTADERFSYFTKFYNKLINKKVNMIINTFELKRLLKKALTGSK